VFDAGKFGVVLFFCISGYVIPPTLNSNRPNDTRRFVVGRFFRLYPLYWLSIPLALMFPWREVVAPLDVRTIVVNLTMFQAFVGIENVMGLYWTLQVELAFYILCICLSRLGALHDMRKVLLTSGAFLLLAVAMSAVRFVLNKKLPIAMPLGLAVMFWASSLRLQGTRFFNSRNGLIALAAIIPLISILAYSRDYGFNERPDRYICSYYAAVGLFALVWRLKRLSWKPLVFVGTVSYSLYLLHPTVFAVLRAMRFDDFLLRHLPPFLAIITQIAIVIPAAFVTYWLVERPFHNIGRALQRRISSRASALKDPPAHSIDRYAHRNPPAAE
jgi:peptidoglycan/LPS O-acetylase OafA/YrhL